MGYVPNAFSWQSCGLVPHELPNRPHKSQRKEAINGLATYWRTAPQRNQSTKPCKRWIADPVPTMAPNPYVEPVEPEPVPEPEPDFAQQIVVAVNALRDARLTHDDAPTRQRKADTAVADVEVQRTLAMSEQQKAVEFAEQSRSDVLAAYDGLITAVQAARDAFRAG